MTGRHLALCTLLTVAACLPAAWSPADEPAKAVKPAADSMLGNAAGDVRDENGLKMKLVWCPPGVFTMQAVGPKRGDDGVVRYEATPAVKVVLTHGYWLGRFEVTQAEWKQAIATEPWKGKDRAAEGNDHPAMWVSWEDAMAFCRRLTHEERTIGRLPDGWEYTLPTEAQWQRACGARTETRFSFGDEEAKMGDHGWYGVNSVGSAHKVGQKKPNPWGLYDMYGNVKEWCRDCYIVAPPGGRDPEVSAVGIIPREGEASVRRVIRGGDYNSDADKCGHRGNLPSMTGSGVVGFRVALTPVQPAK